MGEGNLGKRTRRLAAATRVFAAAAATFQALAGATICAGLVAAVDGAVNPSDRATALAAAIEFGVLFAAIVALTVVAAYGRERISAHASIAGLVLAPLLWIRVGVVCFGFDGVGMEELYSPVAFILLLPGMLATSAACMASLAGFTAVLIARLSSGAMSRREAR